MSAKVRAIDEDREEKLDDGSVRVRLWKPIRSLDETLDTITFREPTARDIRECGDPVSIENDERDIPRLRTDEIKMTAMMSRLAGVPVGSINTMKAVDWKNCSWALAGFFVPRLPPEEPVQS